MKDHLIAKYLWRFQSQIVFVKRMEEKLSFMNITGSYTRERCAVSPVGGRQGGTWSSHHSGGVTKHNIQCLGSEKYHEFPLK